MKYFVTFFLAALFWVSTSQALRVVRIQSGELGLPPSHTGSGILFKGPSGEIFALTSDHIVNRNFGDVIHIIHYSGADGQTPVVKLNGTLVLADWGRGIALLKLENPPAGLATDPEIKDFATELILPTTPVTELELQGFPAGSSLIVKQKSAKWVDSPWQALLPFQILNFLRGEEAHVEFGMSGGAAINDQGQLAGLISHQIFVNRSPIDHGPGAIANQSQAIVIPFSRIRPVIEEFLAGKNSKWNFFEFTQSKSLSHYVYSGPLRIELSIVRSSADMLRIDLVKKAPMNTSLYPSSFLDLSLGKLQGREENRTLPSHTPNTVYILGFREKGNFSSKWKRLPPTMDQVLVNLDNPALEPVSHMSFELIDDVRDPIFEFKRKFHGCYNIEVNGDYSLCQRLQWISEALDIENSPIESQWIQWAVIKPSDIKDLLENRKYHEQWQKMPPRSGSPQNLRALYDFFVQVTL